MNLLGKIYNEYILEGSYFGYNVLYDDSVIVLSDKILKIDLQTGDIICDYGINDNYDFLDVYEEDIVVGRDNLFYKIRDNVIEEVQYNIVSKVNSFYDSTNNYQIVLSNKFGELKETDVSYKNIKLFSYDNMKDIDNIFINQDSDRIKVVNNTDNDILVILDKFMDKRVYEVSDIKYINLSGLSGKYTIYLEIDGNLYKTDFFVEV